MRNDLLFDEWTDTHYDDVLEREFATGIQRLVRGVEGLLSPELAVELAKAALLQSMTHAYSRPAANERLQQTDFSDPAATLEALTEFEFTLRFQARGLRLKCFAHIGHLSGDDGLAPRETIEEAIAWGECLLADCFRDGEAPFFRLVLAASRARLAIDFGGEPAVEDFIRLAALASWKISDRFGAELLNLPAKTIQNQLSAKSLERTEDGRIEREGALRWLQSHAVHPDMFPSAIFLPDDTLPLSPPIDDPIFVPISRTTSQREAIMFLPEQKNGDTYEVRTTAKICQYSDYFDALSALQRQPAGWFRPAGAAKLIPLSGDFCVQSRQAVEALRNEVNAPANKTSFSLSDECVSVLEAHPDMRLHPRGHSKKLRRFISKGGVELAIEARIGRPLAYVLRSEAAEAALRDIDHEFRAQGLTGRNSNLNAMRTFRDAALLAFRPATLDQLRRILQFVLKGGDNAK